MIPEEQIDEAIGRLALTEDGRMLHLRLQRVLMATCPSAESGALQMFEGRRSLAADLKRLLDAKLAETVGAGSRSDHDRPIVIAPRRAVDYGGGGRGLSRRVSDYPEQT